MPKSKQKISLEQRLNIIKGQIDGLNLLIKEKANCQKVTDQFYAINSALKRIIELYLKENLNSCLNTIKPKKRETIKFLLKEIIKNK